MKYIFALSNFGKKYEKNYHNIGLLCLEHFLQDQVLLEEKDKDKYIFLKYENFCAIKSKVFMNVAAQALAPIYNLYKIEPKQLLVLHDDLSVKPFEVKIKEGGGNAGHNGLRSLSQTFGCDFFRLRIGIGHPHDFNANMDVSSYVLSNINNLKDWEKSFQKAKEIINNWLSS